ncbi:hypothetical protein METP3_01813 [Methanosarcinales archaeon]|nr:hypothetical protein METP3_01813 [Methanosarcinales archaeon]
MALVLSSMKNIRRIKKDDLDKIGKKKKVSIEE